MQERFIEDFETNSVKVYKQAEELIKKKAELAKAWNLLHDNYDSKFIIHAEAYSSHNYNQGYACTQAIPLDVILGTVPTKEDVLAKLLLGIDKIDRELSELYDSTQG